MTSHEQSSEELNMATDTLSIPSTSANYVSTSSSVLSPPAKSLMATSGNSIKSSTQNRKQQAAHKARILALSKQLTTRLQYATFKVEHGWSKQSLSEVENLYYRHRKGGSSSNMPISSTPSSGPQLSPSSSLRKASFPTTPRTHSKPSGSTPLNNKRHSFGHETDIFGGLMTPPASGGMFPAHAEKESFSGHPSFSSGMTGHQQKSPTVGLDGKGGGGGGGGGGGNKGRSYADFWSKIGNAGPAQANERQ